MQARLRPTGQGAIHPGEILRKDFLEPARLSATALAKALGVTPPRVNDILLKRRGVTADTALRLARYFGGKPTDWLLLQLAYDLRVAEIANGETIARDVTPRASGGTKKSDRIVR
jgi:addiction module HigA family antidote